MAFVLGHEGEKSLLAQLKRENLVEALGAGGSNLGEDNSIFSISITLTEKGVIEVDRVIELCAQAVNQLRESGIPRYIFDEIQKMDAMDYQFQSESEVFSVVQGHARGICDEDLSTYPMETTIIQEYDPNIIDEFLQCLTIDRAMITIVARSELTGVYPELKEQWMGGEYSIVPIEGNEIKHWCTVGPHENIDLPEPNPFIPENFDLINTEVTQNGGIIPPDLIVDNAWGKVYFEEDNRYLVPEVIWKFNFRTAQTEQPSPRNDILMSLYLRAIYENLNSVSYQASLGGLGYSLSDTSHGLSLVLQGYSDKTRELLLEILPVMKNCAATKEKFELYRDSLRRQYENAMLASPLNLGFELVRTVINKDNFLPEEKLLVMESVTYEDFVSFCNNFYDEVYIESLLYGNMTQEGAEKIWTDVHNSFETTPFPTEKLHELQILRLEDGSDPIIMTKDTERKGNAVILMIEDNDFTFENRAAQQILTKAMNAPFFGELRTKQQTAYIVNNWCDEIERELMFFFAIQSNTHDTRDLLSRFELFIEDFLLNIHENISREDFENIKKTFIDSLTKLPDNQMGMASMLSNLAFDYDADFEWFNKRIDGFRKLSYNEFVAIAQKFISRNNKKRLAILINGVISKTLSLQYNTVEPNEIQSLYYSRQQQDAA